MKRIALVLTALALALGTTYAFAGGAECAQQAKAKAAKSEHHSKAAERAKHGWLGLDTEKGTDGYVVTKVAAGSPAEAAGFRGGDVLVALNGIPLNAENHDRLKAAKSSLGVGSEVEYTVRRGGYERSLTATLGEVPAEVMARWEAEEEAARGEQVADRN